MVQEYDIEGITNKIQTLKQTAIELKAMSGGIQAIDRNVDRILASIRILELNVAEVANILFKKIDRKN